MVSRVKRRLGLGAAPTVGVQFTESGAYVALVRPRPVTVVGLGHVPLPIGTVVDGQIRRPSEAGAAVEAALSTVHWPEQPSLRATVQPEPWGGSRPGGVTADEGLVTAVVRDSAHDSALDSVARAQDAADGQVDIELGIIAAAEQTVTSVAAAMESVTGAVRSIEPTPVAVARFLRMAWPRQALRFARLSTPHGRWTLCDGGGSFEVEVVRRPGGLAALVDGPDQTRLTSTQWGQIPVERAVKSKVAQPHLFAPAVGAAIGEYLSALSGDLLGPGSAAATRAEPFGRWTMENVR